MTKTSFKSFFLLLILILGIQMSGFAQVKQDFYRHDVKLSFGALFKTTQSPFMLDEMASNRLFYFDPSGDYYSGDLKGTPMISASYSYHLRSWLALGVELGFGWRSQKLYNIGTRAEELAERELYVGVVPSLQITWINRSWFQLYSSVGYGFGGKTFRNKSMINNTQYSEKEFVIFPDVNVLGVAVGKKWYGFCEGGISAHGILNLGIGYRFNK